jgi:hypothetical protein
MEPVVPDELTIARLAEAVARAEQADARRHALQLREQLHATERRAAEAARRAERAALVRRSLELGDRANWAQRSIAVEWRGS